MPTVLIARLVLDLAMFGLILSALAYWWFDNLTHEVLGTAFLLLVAFHMIVQRRWFGRVARDGRRQRNWPMVILNVAFLVAMVTLAVTSLAISRTVFAFLGLDGGRSATAIHLLAAYWIVLLAGLHIGLNWQTAMNLARTLFRIKGKSLLRAIVLRLGALALALNGCLASAEMAIGSKLVGTTTLDMWDFGESGGTFLLNYGSIVGLYAAIAHYLSSAARRLRRRVQPRRA